MAETYSVDDPATGEIVTTRTLLGEAEARDRVRLGAEAQARWASTAVEERVELVEAFAGRALASRDSIAAEITAQMGKPISEARGEVGTMVERARGVASLAVEALAPRELPPREGFLRRILRQPLGVVLDVPAWNYPLLTAVNAVVPAVLAGNSVILRHSRRTPLCGDHFVRCFDEAGAPEGLVQALDLDHATTAALLAEPAVGYVCFTGSVAGGRSIYRAVGEGRFIDCGLELGGKDPAYVRADADLETAVPAIAEGAFYNTGQSCCAVERVYVDRSRYDAFVTAFVEEVRETYRPGDPRDEATTQGALAQASAPPFLTAQVADARDRGGEVLLGGEPVQVDGRGRFFEPTVVAGATEEMELTREETFGPVIGLQPVDGDDEAVARMNASPYGLTASLWSRDVDAAAALAERIEAGTVYLNRCDYLDPELPWTGYKDSGKGSTLSSIGIACFTRPKAVHFRLPPDEG